MQHAPLASSRCADVLGVERPGVRLKNLFLRDNYGRQHFILVIPYDKQVDLKALSKQMQLSRLGFASKERLARYLATEPGHLSLLNWWADKQHAVKLWLDESLDPQQIWQCHPFDNRYTALVDPQQRLAFFRALKRQPQVISVPSIRE
ncbi:hypothetical protein GCM10007895_32320 [Paraferrimonas sedimenticola]|uniref:YbaK/aminoacyl-tRNA synthetase-associated domain-containing protein n=2 Tax=Paraferrimonas sedimenticola TaxID=375674 RepID=A0AA37RYW8_9GAMM|nr:hypothetical protein GCM10007895_32320 [Paraferrimonas sedimenticola]